MKAPIATGADAATVDAAAIVTGAASGMGRIYAKRLVQMGYTVLAVDRNEAALQSLCEANQGSIVPIVQDLSKDDAIQNISQIIDSQNFNVKILINNAGFIFTSAITRTDPVLLRNILRVHCETPLLLCREFIPRMLENGGGYVLNISSIAAWMPWCVIGMYGNTKRFVKAYSRQLRIELPKDSNVSVTTAIFGAVDTPLFGFTPKIRKIMRNIGVMITPEKAVDKALTAMFRRKSTVIPGLLNRLIIPLCTIVPDCLLKRLYRKFGLWIEKF